MEERSPYAAPTSTALPASADYRTARHGHLSGGDDDWTIRSILIEAWHLTRGYKGIFWLAILVYVAALLAVVSVEQWVRQDPSLGPLVAALPLLGQLLIMPLAAGLFMLGVYRAADVPLHLGMLFAYYHRLLGLLLLNLLLVLMLMLGLILLVLPGIYLMIAYTFALPLLVEKKIGAWAALEASRQGVGPCWFRLLGLMLMSVLLLVLGMLTLGVGVIWVVPMLSIAYGLVYVKLFGVYRHG